MTPFAIGLVLLFAMAPQAPAPAADSNGDPVWNKRLQLADGRMFVSDGAFAIDASIAKVTALASMTNVPGAVIDRFLQAPVVKEVRLTDLVSSGGHYVTPDGMRLNRRYVDYLRRTVAARRVGLRVTGDLQPIIVTLETRAIGVLMPMAK